MRMLTPALILTLALAGADPDAEAAYADWVANGNGHYAYATVSTEASQPRKERLARQLAFVACSLSSKPYLGDQLPVKINENLYRLDLQGLGWARVWPEVMRRFYPYRKDLTGHAYPLVVRADWIVAELPDPIQTGNAQYLLLYGRELKTGKEFREFWGVNGNQVDAFGFIEGRSGVQAKGAQRLMANRPTNKRYSFFETFDSKKVAGNTSPSERLKPGDLHYDGQELIARVPKYYLGEGGTTQAYFLNNGNTDPDKRKHDTRVDAAPPDLVHDVEGLRGFDIRNFIDCASCHDQGMKMPTVNQYREIITAGQRVYADKATKEEIERFYESPFMKELQLANEGYATAIRLINGLTPERNCSEFKACIRAYDDDVTPSQAAREAYLTPTQLRNAIAEYSPSQRLSEALVRLAHGAAISRDEWVDAQKLLQCEVIPAWRGK